MLSEENIKFEQLTIDDGLSQSIVQCMIQDRQGFMWFGTQDGLNRYDGYKFIIYKNDSSVKNTLNNNNINCLYEDSEGDLWIGTAGGGLCRYDRDKDSFVNYISAEDDHNSVSNNRIRSVCEDSYGNLWIGTNGGLNKFSKSENKFVHYKNDTSDKHSIRSNSIRSIYEDRDFNLWIGTWGEGINKFERETGRFVSYKKISNSDNSNRINSIYEDSKNNLWISSNDGLQLLDRQSGNIEEIKKIENDPDSLSDNFISQVFEDSNGTLWIGTRQGGLNKFNIEKNAFTKYRHNRTDPNSIGNDTIMSIFEDRSGIIWIGTFGEGLSKFSNHRKNIRHYYSMQGINNSIGSNKIYCFCEDRNNDLWIGTVDSGLNKLNRKTGSFTFYKNDVNDINSISSDRVTDVIEDRNGCLWIATSGGGLNKFTPGNDKFISYKSNKDNNNSISFNTVISLREDSDGIIWIGTLDGGLNKFDPEKETFTHFRHDPLNPESIGSNKVRTLYIDGSGELWIGLEFGGLNKFNRESGTFTHYKNIVSDPDSISDNHVLSICEDSKGRLWVGTANAGLNYFERDKNIFTKFSERHGLPNNSINGILEDAEGNLWISTNNGLSKFNPETGIFKNYDKRDGLQSNEFNPSAFLKLKSGELVFGGINGFNVFYPSDITDNPYIPNVVFTDFLIFNKKIQAGESNSILKKPIFSEDEINLSYRDSVFSFEFASLDFNIPGKNQYAYKMEGFDKNWVYSENRRFATYTNLNPGEYIFKVKGSNNDGVWNEAGSNMKITITPPFWKTIWFKGFTLTAIAGVIGSVYRNKLNQLNKDKNAQEEFTRKLLVNQENDRKRIASELHDSIGHHLLITKNRLLLTEKNKDDTESILRDVHEVTDIISSTINDVKEISYSLHPYQIERLGLTKAIISIIDRVSKSTDIKFISNIDQIDKLLIPETEISLYRIIQECINNIVNHSCAEEVLINLSLNEYENNISVLINDNGKGFDIEKVYKNSDKHGFGLKGIRERVKLFNGKLQIQSSPETGTEFMVSVPIEGK